MSRFIAATLGITGLCLCFASDSLPCESIIMYGGIGCLLILTACIIIIKQHEKEIKYIRMDFIDYYGNHKYIKAYTYAGKIKAILDLRKEGYKLYAETEYTWEGK